MHPDGGCARTMDGKPEADEAAGLLRRIAGERDPEAFARLYDLHAPLLFGLVIRILANRGDAEDVLQEVFLQVWDKAADFDAERGSARTWLVVLARSRCLDRLRRKGRREGRELPLREGGAEPAEAPVGTGGLELSEAGRAVRQALAALPEPQRRAIAASYFDGLSQSEISRQTGEPLGTVKTRMRLGMLKLMELLEPYRDR
ncbi:MAG: sigma-70 family RNA polymerase sigma factor [Elusimicrobia bacterium]|nr:sigma-70 family RNA polymerase sigma factor [Elusimicrobiota bacterium]